MTGYTLVTHLQYYFSPSSCYSLLHFLTLFNISYFQSILSDIQVILQVLLISRQQNQVISKGQSLNTYWFQSMVSPMKFPYLFFALFYCHLSPLQIGMDSVSIPIELHCHKYCRLLIVCTLLHMLYNLCTPLINSSLSSLFLSAFHITFLGMLSHALSKSRQHRHSSW